MGRREREDVDGGRRDARAIVHPKTFATHVSGSRVPPETTGRDSPNRSIQPTRTTRVREEAQNPSKTYRHEAEGFASARRIRGRHGRARDRLAFGALVELRRRGDAGAEGGGSHREHDDDRCECVLMTPRPASRVVQVSLLFRVYPMSFHRFVYVLYLFRDLCIVKMRGKFSYLHMSECLHFG
jgi:hypothetical protein